MSEVSGKNGLGGWLILVGAALFLYLVQLVIIQEYYINFIWTASYEKYTTPGSELYHDLWGPVLVGQILVNSLMLLAGLYAVYLFFKKHKWFPRLFIAILLVTLAAVLVEAWAVSVLYGSESMFEGKAKDELFLSLFCVAVGVPYMLRSKRVKTTFVN